MSEPENGDGGGLGLLLIRIVLGGYVVLAGLNKLAIFVTVKAQAATQPAKQGADPSPGGLLGLPVTFQWPGFGGLKGGLDQFVHGPKGKPGMVDMAPVWLPEQLASVYGYAIPFLEILFGFLLLIGLIARLSSAILLLMIASFTYALAINAGVLMPHIDGGPFHANFLFLAVLLFLALAGPGRASIDGACCTRRERERAESDLERQDDHRGDHGTW